MDAMLMVFGMDTVPKALLMYKGVLWRQSTSHQFPATTSLSVKVTVVFWVAFMASMGRRGHCTSPEPLKIINEHHQFANTLTIQEWGEDESMNDSSVPLLQQSRRLTQTCPLPGVQLCCT
jgi:hypothetical protein